MSGDPAPLVDGVSAEARVRLHRRLDELLDMQNAIAGNVTANGMSNVTADLLAHHAEQLVIRSIRFAGEVAGGDARAIAFRHEDPGSREAFAPFLNAVAEYAAPYAFATLDLGIETFTWTDVMAILDDLRCLDHGDLPDRMRPAQRRKKRGTAYPALREKWRAIQWVAYLSGLVDEAKLKNKMMADAAIFEVAEAYGVNKRSIYNWDRETAQIEAGHFRTWALEEARRAGEARLRPSFTLSPYRDDALATHEHWLAFDASHFARL